MKYLVSSCLAGVACRYNGTASLMRRFSSLVEQEQAKMVCPEPAWRIFHSTGTG